MEGPFKVQIHVVSAVAEGLEVPGLQVPSWILAVYQVSVCLGSSHLKPN